MADTSGHHIVYGELTDYLTQEILRDTDDERLRQQLARFLVEEKGFHRIDLIPRLSIATHFNNRPVKSLIELTVELNGRQVMILRYGPGSLVTRERPTIAAARILNDRYRIPLAVVTNSRDAELLDTYSGKILGQGLHSIPDRGTLIQLLPDLQFIPISDPAHHEKEARILNAYDIEICCHGANCSVEK